MRQVTPMQGLEPPPVGGEVVTVVMANPLVLRVGRRGLADIRGVQHDCPRSGDGLDLAKPFAPVRRSVGDPIVAGALVMTGSLSCPI